MNSLHNELHAKGLEVVAVNLDEDKQLALDFLEKKPVRFLIAQDTQQSCPTQFSVQGMPSTFLIDKQGKLVKAHVGYKPSDAESLRKEIESLL